ncbi:hypothetical protein GCM10017562_08160 [Streptomyces roseofulvus]|uniref:Uncharacterized protein n=2 Tax=Streptomyces TaxID=1883 RepID=A0ABU4KDI7_9ACTN|nr:hypothetical protein [Streptomyces roseolus]MDX2295830.1 hypothetical protein [Streptomyces roseolus]
MRATKRPTLRTPKPTLPARLLPALLCALCAFLTTPAPAPAFGGAPGKSVGALAPAPLPDGPSAAAAADGGDSGADAVPAEAVEPGDAVEHVVRFPVPPAAPVLAADAVEPAADGRAAGDPRRERAPPGLPYDPTAPRGPPSTRHS